MPQTGSGSERLDRDSIAEVGQTFDQALFLSIGGTSIEVVAAEVLVHRAVFEHVVDRGKDRGRDLRISWVCVSGTKLARIRPCANRSVLRPGTFLTCAAFANANTNSPSSKICHTGFQ
jgi:hypothetical protein